MSAQDAGQPLPVEHVYDSTSVPNFVSPLVNIREFQQTFLELIKADEEEQLSHGVQLRGLPEDVDLSFQDAAATHPVQEIENAIAKEMTRIAEEANRRKRPRTSGSRMGEQSSHVETSDAQASTSAVLAQSPVLSACTLHSWREVCKRPPIRNKGPRTKIKENPFVSLPVETPQQMLESVLSLTRPPPPPRSMFASSRRTGSTTASTTTPAPGAPQVASKEKSTSASASSGPPSAGRNPSRGGVREDEVLLSVAVYHPHKAFKMQEWVVLGSQPLTALRDSIYCLADRILDGPSCRNAFLFIENVFYNDMRHPNAMDYSQFIIQWASKASGLPQYTSASMHDTNFIDLQVRVGEHYVYCHQGNCQHIITFTDIRLVHDQDEMDACKYPIIVFHGKLRRRKCSVCRIFPAQWVCHGDRLADSSPCFFCNGCYRTLHYARDGQLLYQDFVVYPYYHE